MFVIKHAIHPTRASDTHTHIYILTHTHIYIYVHTYRQLPATLARKSPGGATPPAMKDIMPGLKEFKYGFQARLDAVGRKFLLTDYPSHQSCLEAAKAYLKEANKVANEFDSYRGKAACPNCNGFHLYIYIVGQTLRNDFESAVGPKVC